VQGEHDATPAAAYRVRTAEPSDDVALRAEIGTTLAHPDKQGKRESYRGAASRGDLLVLERYDRQARTWHMAGFVECHMRVDDNLSIRDVGTQGEEPHAAVVRYLLEQAFDSYRPVAAQIKVRRDAGGWRDILRSIPGFFMEGEEYRRPHYWTIWRWDREHAREAEQRSSARPPAARTGGPPRPPGPRPPGPPPAGPRPARGPRPDGRRPQPGPARDGRRPPPPRGPRPPQRRPGPTRPR
jgi:hypothetical protein